MIFIPFTKLHGAENDFLLTWEADVPRPVDLAAMAQRICARNTGIGADGWMLVERDETGLRTRLFNSDGSEAEISGNGTRCAAAFALRNRASSPPEVVVTTAAGVKQLRLLGHEDNKYLFEMDMGQPRIEELQTQLNIGENSWGPVILNVGNPQCVFLVDPIPADWLAVAKEAEQHPRFPNRTNISFVRPVDKHTLEVVFFERGAGETRSSGTGSTGAAVAAILRKVAESPVEVITPAGSLFVRWDESVFLTGPAEVTGEGRFFL